MGSGIFFTTSTEDHAPRELKPVSLRKVLSAFAQLELLPNLLLMFAF